jgi:hypothetical protein
VDSLGGTHGKTVQRVVEEVYASENEMFVVLLDQTFKVV